MAGYLKDFYFKIDYGVYWFGVCFQEWYDTVIKGQYDLCKEPSWGFFNHINCNFPLEYRYLSSKPNRLTP